MRVLLTNDDGVEAAGIQSNIAAMRDAGHDVVVVAPAGNRSAMGHRVTVREQVELDLVTDEENLQVWSCSGTPADCVRMAVFADWIEPVDVVVSGTNHGVNLGEDVFYSGTFAAALEAVYLGLPAVASSQAGADADPGFLSEQPSTFPYSGYVVHFAESVVHARVDGVVFNLNFPLTLAESSVRLAVLGSRHWEKSAIQARQRTDGYTVERAWAADPAPQEIAGSDFTLLTAGSATVTPLSARGGLRLSERALEDLQHAGLSMDISKGVER